MHRNHSLGVVLLNTKKKSMKFWLHSIFISLNKFMLIALQWRRIGGLAFQNAGKSCFHYIDVIMTTMASQITSLTVVYSTVYSDADKKKTPKPLVTGLCAGNSPGPVNSPHKGPVTRKMFQFDDVIMLFSQNQTKHQSSALPPLCQGNPSVTVEFPSQRFSDMERVSM